MRDLRGLAGELDLCRVRAAAGTLRTRVSLEDLVRLVGLPRSTLHRYVTGRTLMPSAVLDRIVIALGATPAEQREWNEAWYRLHGGGAPSVVPWCLPPPARGFTGRARESAALDGLVPSGEGVVLAAVTGGPGVGKTALVVHWAHRVRERFPDGCLFVDLCGYGPDRPLDPAQALGTLLGSLAPDEPVPAEPPVRVARYRSLLARRKMLVLLDNASCAEQVRPLLPGAGAGMVVVTGRDDLAGLVAGDGAHPVGLDVLPPQDAVALLENLLGPGRASPGLAWRCGLLPLALRVAALGGRVPAEGLGWLETGDPRTDVRTVFSWSYRAVADADPEAAALFRALGRHRGADVDLAIAAALGHTTPERAGRLLATLVRANLVQVVPGGYRLPHLLAAYAAELSADAGLRSARGGCERLPLPPASRGLVS
ncbi:helix-turn-helix protein [Actinophytocola oryzae]|uniref:Helix-turn-helix protein n=1 Tax=Actinophytocola oryzae TaxID=502181 RepID=A0A4R7USH0_9PSEU|nr:helix-turn-helix protein [Actinophytocola oryzae]